uniref:Major facilitator superfamily (MFS) profile domain-containing protein n=1 Tax=Craspedostauros australis TaxID=1486917 RepID=A0A7R9ZM90_9STRA|mmetsp:Transcript_19393/g.53953  ORF Transcript_19393/g.53953 Transcript_19393/m.53953 type:complete len:178 (+) Transcript_19393:277-810(+)
MVTSRLNPNTSWSICMGVLLLVLVAGALILGIGDLGGLATYIWGVCVGLCLGWFYCTENLYFSMCLPKGQEAELSGFFVYATQILGWLPPLLFTVLVESGIDQTWGVVITSFGFLAAICLLRCSNPWDEVVAEANHEVVKDEGISVSQHSSDDNDKQKTVSAAMEPSDSAVEAEESA